jgi:putative tryptophan/tyrosine transport system substrate-binding protein
MKRREFIAGLAGAAAWPLAAQAQRPAVPVIGFLSWQFPMPNADYVMAFRQGLADAGYVEGRNVAIEYRWANNQARALWPLAEELVHRPVAAIVAANSNSAALAAKAATSTVPIVFVYGGDPVNDGLVASLNRPGGNMTGVGSFTIELLGKRLGLLCDLVPRATLLAFLSGDPSWPTYDEQKSAILAAASALGRKIVMLETSSNGYYDAAFTTLMQSQAGGLIVGSFVFQNVNRILALAAQHKIPTIYPGGGYVAAGGLMSYGAVIVDLYRQAGIYAGRILKGEKPVDLPVVRPTKFELVINLKTAKALGIEMPDTLLATADKVIE